MAFGNIMEPKTWVTIETWCHFLVQAVLDAAHCFRNPHMTHDISGHGATQRPSQSVPLFRDTGDLYTESIPPFSPFPPLPLWHPNTKQSTSAEFAYMEIERRRLHLFMWQTLLSKTETGNDPSLQLSSWGERSSSGSHDAELLLWSLSEIPLPPSSYIQSTRTFGTRSLEMCSLYWPVQNVPAVHFFLLSKKSSSIRSEKQKWSFLWLSHSTVF